MRLPRFLLAAALLAPALLAQAQVPQPLQALPQGASFCEVDSGEVGVVLDNGFYLVWRAAGVGGSPVRSDDLRLGPFGGKPAGTMVGDADATEHAACIAGASRAVGFGPAAGATNVYALDLDGSGRYSGADCVLLDRDASGSLTRHDLRLSACDLAGQARAAGTLVELGDRELAATPAAVGFTAGVAIAYQDADGTGAPGPADLVYLARTTCADCAYAAPGDLRLYRSPLAPPSEAPPPPAPPGNDTIDLAALRVQLEALTRAFEAQQAERTRLAETVANITAQVKAQLQAGQRLQAALAEAEEENARLQAERDAPGPAPVPALGAAWVMAALGGLAWLARRQG